MSLRELKFSDQIQEEQVKSVYHKNFNYIVRERFYFQQQQRGKSRMAWDEEKKAQAVEMYEAESPTPETSMEIVKAIADELSESPNGVRMILTKAGVYVKKTPATGSAKNGGGSGTSRVSKAAAQDCLLYTSPSPRDRG